MSSSACTSDDHPVANVELSVDRTTIGFGAVGVGGASAAETLVVSNVGTVASDAVVVAISNAVFRVDATSCAGALDAGASCTVAVSFRPVATGTVAGALTVGGLSVALTGQGVDGTVPVDDTFTVVEDAAATELDVLANDGATGAIIASVTQPEHGVVAIASGGGALTYAPVADWCSTQPDNVADTFTYAVAGASATVSVFVACVDDPAVAVDDAATATEGGPSAAIDVLANDTDVDGGALTIASVTQPPEGTVTLDTDGLGLSYQPATYPTATEDSFTYTLNGGSAATVRVAVTMLTTGCMRPAAETQCVHGICSDGGTAAVSCACDEGWQGVACDTDINECIEGSALCDEHAECINGAGTYRCQCVSGFEGDGTVCVDVDECASDVCGAGRACTNTAGGYRCTCKPGLLGGPAGNGGVPAICYDVDECAEGAGECTGQGVSCVNGEGSFDCVYTGCGDTCAIPSFCSTYDNNICPFPTSCSNPSDPTNGFCLCTAEGFEEGPGGGCFDIDECQRGTATGFVVNATCRNLEPGYEWVCNVAGSRIVDGRCVDIDECADGALVCNGSGTVCENRSPGAACVCDGGYVPSVGTVFDATATCEDIDECAEGLACDPAATCVNTDGSFECVCPEGTFADGFGCDALVASAEDCDPLATFVATAPAHCECLEGFVGDGTRCVLDTRSTGLDGAFAPAESLFLSRLVYHFSTIHIPEGVTVQGPPPGWLELRATGDVVIDGTIDMRGQNAAQGQCNASTGNPDGRYSTYAYDVPGIGWVPSGTSGTGITVISSAGRYGGGCYGARSSFGPRVPTGGGGYAGGGSGCVLPSAGSDEYGQGSPGDGPDGGGICQGGRGPGPYAGHDGYEVNGLRGAGGGGIGADAAADLAVSRTFRPGSGGGGGGGSSLGYGYNFGGAGAGGALRIISATRIVINGLVTVRGGDGGDASDFAVGVYYLSSGGGSGGVVYLSAPEIVVNGSVIATGGTGSGGTVASSGGLGRIRLSVDPAQCNVDAATFDPPLEDGCAASPAGGTSGTTYVGVWPE